MADVHGFFGEHRFLSNFWFAEVEYDGVTYPSTEHAYQAAKTLDLVTRQRIREAPQARDAKKIGGDKLQTIVTSDWEDRKYGVMADLVWQKFSKHPHLRDQLLATGDAYLEETNAWNDTYWGVCRGVGSNRLGEILMNVRAALRNGVQL